LSGYLLIRNTQFHSLSSASIQFCYLQVVQRNVSNSNSLNLRLFNKSINMSQCQRNGIYKINSTLICARYFTIALPVLIGFALLIIKSIMFLLYCCRYQRDKSISIANTYFFFVHFILTSQLVYLHLYLYVIKVSLHIAKFELMKATTYNM
jgi:hypothetical protein